MKTSLDMEKTQILQNLLNEAREEAEGLRKRMERLEHVVLSTRLIMGHELKKPTTAISGYLDLALEDAEEHRFQDSAANVERAREECELLNELNLFFLELLKVDQPEQVRHGGRATIQSILHDILDNFSETLQARERVEIEATPEAEDFTVNANAFKIILTNVVENALNYSPKDGKVIVEIETAQDKRGMGDRNLLKIRVSDQGPGIPKVHLTRIFSPFVRLQSTAAEGSGLGLTLVRSLVELCDGNVYVRSGQEGGTVVHVTIPEIHADEESGKDS